MAWRDVGNHHLGRCSWLVISEHYLRSLDQQNDPGTQRHSNCCGMFWVSKGYYRNLSPPKQVSKMSFCLEHSKTHSTNPSLSKPIIPVVSPPSAPNSDIIYRVTVRQFPPKESFSNRVNLESRKGTNAEPEAKALIQFPKANRDRLILAPSKSRIPLLCV